jgi:DNA-binding NtrC family response regulator
VTSVASLLVADDDPVALDLLAEVLRREGYHVRVAGGGAECVRLAAAEPIDLALVDLRMPDLDGLAVVKQLASIRPGVPVLILTAFATIDTAIETIRAGAYDYLSKPFRMEEIKLAVRRTLDAQRLVRENAQYRQELRDRYRVDNLVGQSPRMVEIYKLIARVASLDTTVLVQGETGTGKELVARAIHYASTRADRPFVVVDCAALPESLIESELFGHERGAFTGAVSARRGLMEAASGGTCFLDEIGELPLGMQAKLLRAVQERAVRRVGGNDPIAVDVRIIAATNRDLRKQVENAAFREDLYFRLNVVTLAVPPLRDRREDIAVLAQHFLERYAQATGKPIKAFAPEALAMLSAADWPGNVRELQHAVERAVALASAELLLPHDFTPPAPPGDDGGAPRLPQDSMTLEDVKRWYVLKVLDASGGNKVRAAEALGIDRRTLYRILERQSEDDGEAG